MKILDGWVIYNADDEEPNCGVCDNQDFMYCCDRCGPTYWWRHYERKEQNSEINKLYKVLEKLGLKMQIKK